MDQDIISSFLKSIFLIKEEIIEEMHKKIEQFFEKTNSLEQSV